MGAQVAGELKAVTCAFPLPPPPPQPPKTKQTNKTKNKKQQQQQEGQTTTTTKKKKESCTTYMKRVTQKRSRKRFHWVIQLSFMFSARLVDRRFNVQMKLSTLTETRVVNEVAHLLRDE